MDQARAEIINRIFENSEAMKRGMYGHMQAYFRDLPLARAPLEVLSAVHHLQPVSAKTVARQLYLTPGAISQSVESLNQLGYLLREPDPADRRVYYLKLSKKGEKLFADVEKHRRQLMEQAMDDLTLDELTTWHRVQTKMLEQYKINPATQTKKETK